MLLAAGVDPDPKHRQGITPLALAVLNMRTDVVRLLLATKGVDPNSHDKYGHSPLSRAEQADNPAVLNTLLDHFKKTGIPAKRMKTQEEWAEDGEEPEPDGSEHSPCNFPTSYPY